MGLNRKLWGVLYIYVYIPSRPSWGSQGYQVLKIKGFGQLAGYSCGCCFIINQISSFAFVLDSQKFKLRGSVLKRSPQQSPRKLVMKVCSQNRTARVASWCLEEHTTLVGTEPHVLQHATWIYLVWNQSASDISVGSSQMTSMSIWGTSQPAVSRGQRTPSRSTRRSRRPIPRFKLLIGGFKYA